MRLNRSFTLFILVPFIFGCVSIPVDIFQLSPDSLKKRQLQTRQYETKDDGKIITASAGVLQDLGFNIDESETKLGLVVGSKDRSAINPGQIAFATLAVAAAAMGGTYSDAAQRVDKNQKMRASVVTKLREDKSKTLVRVTFQRVVWRVNGQVSKMQTLDDPELYKGFFERLSKAIFLEEQKI